MFHPSCDPHDSLQDFIERDLLNSNPQDLPYKIDFSPNEGRFLVATRNMEPGEGILTEESLFWSPRYSTHPLCLVCYGYLYSTDICIECQCGWPLCSKECLGVVQGSDHAVECGIFRSNPTQKPDFKKFNFEGIEPAYDVIGPLRLLAEKNSSKWNSAMKLMSHVDNWKKAEGWLDAHESVKEDLKSLFPDTSDEDIYTIFGIYYTNDFGVRVNADSDGSGNPVLCPKIRQLYLLTSLLGHDCTPNTFRVIHSTVKDKFKVEVRAKSKINKGDKITGTYIDVFAPTIVRKKVLRESKLFECTCRRCSEVNDGQGGSDLICPDCQKTAICQLDQSYVCEGCKKPYPEGPSVLLKHYEDMEELLEDQSRCSVQDFENFILERKEVLHPTNLIFIRLMYNLSGFYGRLPGFEMHVITTKALLRKWEVGKEVKAALDAFDMGLSTYKGMIYYELHMPMIMLTKMEFDAGDLDYKKAKETFNEALNFLKESCVHLKYENPQFFEGQVYAGAMLSLVPLESFISQI